MNVCSARSALNPTAVAPTCLNPTAAAPTCLGPTPPCPTYVNTEQSYTASCAVGFVGTPVTITIAAGTYGSFVSQLDADTQALNDATAQATAGLVCLPGSSGSLIWPSFGNWIVNLTSKTYNPAGTGSWDLVFSNTTTFGSGSYETNATITYDGGTVVIPGLFFNMPYNSNPFLGTIPLAIYPGITRIVLVPSATDAAAGASGSITINFPNPPV